MKNKKLKARIEELELALEEMTKKNADNASWRENYNRWNTESKNQISDIHALLDSIDFAPAKNTTKPDAYGGTDRVELSAHARIAGMLANMVHRQFQPKSTTTITEE